MNVSCCFIWFYLTDDFVSFNTVCIEYFIRPIAFWGALTLTLMPLGGGEKCSLILCHM